MSEPCKAMMGTAVAGGPDRANKAADMAVACPLLEGIDLSGARGGQGAQVRCRPTTDTLTADPVAVKLAPSKPKRRLEPAVEWVPYAADRL